jgi:hypothetical protein
MLRGIFQCLVIVFVTNPVWAASDPFVGKWKVDPSRSKLYDEMKVEVSGADKYTFTFGPGQVDSVVADGSDQPALSGTTLSVTVKSPNHWEVVRKIKGRMLLKAEWTLSEDDKRLEDAFTQYLPDGTSLFSQPLPNGSTLFLPYVYERTAGNSGFLGTWDSESAKVKASLELAVEIYQGDGLSFKRSDEGVPMRILLDGKDYPDLDPNRANPDATVTGRRVNSRNLQVTFKAKGQNTGSLQIELSQDLRTLTRIESIAGQSKPKSILVFDRVDH